MTIRRLTRSIAAVVGGAALSISAGTLLAGAAVAHIDPEPTTAEAGSTTTVQFKVEHGCDGSPTTKLEIRVPQGATNPAVVDKPGWTGTVAGGVVTYTGGPLGPDTEDTFGVTVTLPATPGEASFPIIQTCEQGSIDWIEATQPGGAEPENPAPVLTVTPSTSTATTTAPAGSGTTSAPAATTGDASEHGHDEAATTDPYDTGLDTIAGVGGGKQVSNGNLILGGAVAVIVVVAGGLGFTAWRRRDGQKDASS